MKISLGLLTAEIGFLFLVLALALFLAAGTLAWPAGWAFLGVFFIFVVGITAWLFRRNPGLLTERMTGLGQSSQKAWDKIFYIVLQVIFIAWLILMALDAVRFRWSQVPVWLQVIGAVILLCSFYLFYLTFRENSYLSPAVRIQSERGQMVISTGPYHYVRHPMYSAGLLFFLGTSLLLGSLYGLVAALVLICAIGIRAVLEERTLRQELEGYETYMAQVKYRLIPYLW